MADKIILIGFMGAGKTYMGEMIANHFNLKLFDTDEQIEKTAGMSINEIFMHGGENYFRKFERSVISRIYKEKIISTGAGLVDSYLNCNWLKEDNNYVVWLNPEWETIWERIVNSTRPKVRTLNKDAVYKLWEQRYPLYKECADYTYEKDDPQELIKHLQDKLSE